MITSEYACLDVDQQHKILDLVEEWVRAGESGFSLPVINGDILKELCDKAQDRANMDCSICDGLGYIKDYDDRFKCRACDITTERSE